MSEFEFAIDFASLTDEERHDFLALIRQRTAADEEKLEGLQENVRILAALWDLIGSRGAPVGTGLGAALVGGYIDPLDVVEAIRSV